MRTFVALPYSPWSEKARWALDHHHVPYREVEHVPMLGEPLLRAKLRKLRGRVSVPVLFDEGAYEGSWTIAQHADELGGGTPLFADADEKEIARWNEASDRIIEAGRRIVLERMAKDDQAKMEALPPFVPSSLRRAMIPVSSMGTAFVARKWRDVGPAEPEGAIRGVLEEVRAALRGKKHLVGDRLTYADVAIAAACQFAPVEGGYVRLGPGTRRVWRVEALARDFADVVAWRDETYAAFRRS